MDIAQFLQTAMRGCMWIEALVKIQDVLEFNIYGKIVRRIFVLVAMAI